MTEDEKNLITSAKEGNSEAFGKLYDFHASRIYRFIFLKISNKNDTEDLLHEVFLSAWKNIGTFEHHVGIPFTSWLYQIARNRIIDHYRAHKRNVSLDEVLENPSLPIELVSSEHNALTQALNREFELRHVMQALSHLSDDYQNVLIMRYIEDLSPGEIAAAMRKTPGAVRIIQHRALKQLKTIIEQPHGKRIAYKTT